MRHLVTISLVFFSLSHLAKVDRMETMRFMTQSFNDRHTTPTEQRTVVQTQDLQDLPQLFLSNNQLSVMGVLPDLVCAFIPATDSHSLYSVVLDQPQNKSP